MSSRYPLSHAAKIVSSNSASPIATLLGTNVGLEPSLYGTWEFVAATAFDLYFGHLLVVLQHPEILRNTLQFAGHLACWPVYTVHEQVFGRMDVTFRGYALGHPQSFEVPSHEFPN